MGGKEKRGASRSHVGAVEKGRGTKQLLVLQRKGVDTSGWLNRRDVQRSKMDVGSVRRGREESPGGVGRRLVSKKECQEGMTVVPQRIPRGGSED